MEKKQDRNYCKRNLKNRSEIRGVVKALSDMYDGAFLQKLTDFIRIFYLILFRCLFELSNIPCLLVN